MISSIMKMNVAKDYESNDSNALLFCSDKIRGLSVGRQKKTRLVDLYLQGLARVTDLYAPLHYALPQSVVYYALLLTLCYVFLTLHYPFGEGGG